MESVHPKATYSQREPDGFPLSCGRRPSRPESEMGAFTPSDAYTPSCPTTCHTFQYAILQQECDALTARPGFFGEAQLGLRYAHTSRRTRWFARKPLDGTLPRGPATALCATTKVPA
jgi:hypothetical protein